MQILLDIPDTEIPIERAMDTITLSFENGHVCKCNYPFRVLPKGHGRILDEKDILDTENNDGGWYDLTDMPEYIAGVKAIIDVDKEQKNE